MSRMTKYLSFFTDSKKSRRTMFDLKHWSKIRLFILMWLDAFVVLFCFYLSFVLRLDKLDLGERWPVFMSCLFWVPVVNVSIYYLLGMYRQVWRYANVNSALLIGKCTFVASSVLAACVYLFYQRIDVPLSIPALFFLLSTCLIILTKFSWRFWVTLKSPVIPASKESCLIYGAGLAGEILARHLKNSPDFPYAARGFIDDDRNLRRRQMHGLKVLGSGDDLGRLAALYNIKTVLIAIHAAPGKVIKEVVSRCQQEGINALIMPDLATALNPDVIRPRPVNIQDLLRRSVKPCNTNEIKNVYLGKTVLVTGAGGSIGSEICRQLVAANPKCLVVLDASEFNLYSITSELRDRFPNCAVFSILGSVVSRDLLTEVFEKYKPDIVLHAAAYKHVPLAEENVCETVLNNVFGTQCLVEVAKEFNVERFVMISTDKAVRPSNVMGRTKRACELIVQTAASSPGVRSKFSSVRFGNVLGSSGSVIPRFIRQIKEGGPVTVTHLEVTRYFMLIEEAVNLVLYSSCLSKGGETFVLDMGEPIKIYNMAKQLILLAGKTPGKDVDIVITGLRPGEKLFEELILDGTEENSLVDDVFIARSRQLNYLVIESQIDSLLRKARDRDATGCISLLKEIAHESFAVDNASSTDINLSVH